MKISFNLLFFSSLKFIIDILIGSVNPIIYGKNGRNSTRYVWSSLKNVRLNFIKIDFNAGLHYILYFSYNHSFRWSW